MDVQLATFLGIVATVIGQVLIAYFAYKQKKLLTDVHTATNGMKAEMEKVKFAEGRAEGVIQGEKNATRAELKVRKLNGNGNGHAK